MNIINSGQQIVSGAIPFDPTASGAGISSNMIGFAQEVMPVAMKVSDGFNEVLKENVRGFSLEIFQNHVYNIVIQFLPFFK